MYTIKFTSNKKHLLKYILNIINNNILYIKHSPQKIKKKNNLYHIKILYYNTIINKNYNNKYTHIYIYNIIDINKYITNYITNSILIINITTYTNIKYNIKHLSNIKPLYINIDYLLGINTIINLFKQFFNVNLQYIQKIRELNT